MVRAFAHGAIDRRIDPSCWAYLDVSRSSQCVTTGVTKAVCGMVHIKEHLLLVRKSSPCSGGGGFPLAI